MPAKFTKMPAYTRKMLMNTAKRCQLMDIEEGRHLISGFYKNNKIVFRSFGIYVLNKNENRKSFLNVNLIKDYEKVTKNTLDKLITLKGDFVLDNNGDIVKETTASAESKVFAYHGQVITASSKQEAIQKIVASGNFVGVQKFTKAELKKAWDELVKNIEDDPENKKSPPDNGYDIRNGYSTGEDKDICGKDGHDWSISFDYEDVLKEISRITEVITYGDLEVYWNSNKQNMAEPDNHGIIIEDGKIQQVY